jgi:hypothetical protein
LYRLWKENKISAQRTKMQGRSKNSLLPIALHMTLLGVSISEGNLACVAGVLVRGRSGILLGMEGGARRPVARYGRHFVETNEKVVFEEVQDQCVGALRWYSLQSVARNLKL